MTITDNTVKAPLNWSLIALIAFCLAVYIPLIMHGGIIVDDWGDIAHNLDCNGFFHCYQFGSRYFPIDLWPRCQLLQALFCLALFLMAT